MSDIILDRRQSMDMLDEHLTIIGLGVNIDSGCLHRVCKFDRSIEFYFGARSLIMYAGQEESARYKYIYDTILKIKNNLDGIKFTNDLEEHGSNEREAQ